MSTQHPAPISASSRTATGAPAWALAPLCALVFVLVIAFGSPPQALGLDPAWTEVLAWGFMHHAQWGRDLVFTYGPLGFLHPYASYVSGIFVWFAVGQIVVGAAFALTIGLLLHRSRAGSVVLFVVVFILCRARVTGDVAWALTEVFAFAFLGNCVRRESFRTFLVFAVLLAPVCAAIALIKFSLFPLWALCVAGLAACCLLDRDSRAAIVVVVLFPLALICAWSACGQQLHNFSQFLGAGIEVASGYRHAMGVRAPFHVDMAGMTMLWVFVALCLCAAWRSRLTLGTALSLLLPSVVALLFWMAFFTRADDSHWPAFFAAMAFLPLTLLCNQRTQLERPIAGALILVCLVCAGANLAGSSATQIFTQIGDKARGNLHDLTHLPELHSQREQQWQLIAQSASLPRMRERIGDAGVDMVTWQQGVVLVNAFHYAPRPVFQSYSAYTPTLARKNESYFLGPEAPAFVVFRLDYSDNKLPMSEDALALLALLRRYRPVLVEKGFLLLQLDAAKNPGAIVEAHAAGQSATLDADVPIHATAGSDVAFIDVRLSAFGRLYTLLFREPALDIVVALDDGTLSRYRFTRPSASAGFLLDPMVRSTEDWAQRYFSQALSRARSIRIESPSWWDRLLFEPRFSVVLQPVELLHADPSGAITSVTAMLYPGFNLAPEGAGSIRVIEENNKEWVFLHAPASLTFAPAPGNYRVSATLAFQSAALNDAGCLAAHPDGVGVSLLLDHAATQTLLWHVEIDPFAVPRDRGPHRMELRAVRIGAGDRIEYRIDPGHGGRNVSCDWTLLRDFVFESSEVPASDARQRDNVTANGFE